MGYVRGLQNALRMPEEPRVHALALAARRATFDAVGPRALLHAPRRRLALALTALRVRLLFLLLRIASVLLRCVEPSGARVAPHP